MRIPVLQRERVAIVKLRSLGYSINILSKAFCRSASVINRILKFNVWVGVLPKRDLRKLPNRIRRFSSQNQWKTIMALLPAWNSWILGESEKPP